MVSDIHGNLPALEAVLADVARRNVDAVVNLGDCVSGPLLPLETARFLMQQDWLQIAGNHERQLLTTAPERMNESDAYARSCLGATELDWLRALPMDAWLDAGPPSHDVYLCHGTPRSDVEYFLESVVPNGVRAATSVEVAARLGDVAAPVVLCGHTHVARAVRARPGQLIVNPGSVGLPAYDDVHPFPHAIETGSPDARYAIIEHSANGWVAHLLSVPYDFSFVVALAEKRGRPDWATALKTGYVSPRPTH